METIGSGAVTAPFTAVRDSDVIIVIGANPTGNHPVAATYFKQAAKRGATLIVMDPRGTRMSKTTPTHLLQFKPGGDVSMLNAIMHVIVEEGLYDEQYIQAHTEGFDRLKDHLAKFTPEAMEEICGIEATRSAPWRGPMPTPTPRSSSGAWACRSTSTARTMPAA